MGRQFHRAVEPSCGGHRLERPCDRAVRERLRVLPGERAFRAPVPAAVFCLGMAGSVCGLLDRTLWGGSLDFLQVAGWFVFDVKDCYLVASLGMFVVLALRHQDEFSVSAYARFSKDGALRVANRLRSAIRRGGSTGSS